jgi:serine protease Do
MKRWFIPAACLVLGGLLGSYFALPLVNGQLNQPQQPAVARELTSYRDIVKRVLPAVVSLDAKLKPRAKPEDIPAAQQPGQAPKSGFGSGVIVEARGVVLTSFHVVENAETVLVTLLDGRKFVSQDIRGDRKTDLAVVVLDTKASGALPALQLGDSDAMEIGDRVLAVGAPFGLAGSVTHGIISGKGRSGLNLNLYEDFLQTDAAINPGNSGGPLISLDGKVIGINAAIKSKSGGFQGVGLAVASNLARSVVNALLTEGVVRRGYLGVHVRELSPELAAQLGLNKQPGVVVGEVFENTPAAKAGLKSGDVITSLADKAIPDTRTLVNVVLSLPLNKAAGMSILRDGKAMTLKVTIEEQPEEFGAPRPPGQPQQGWERRGDAPALGRASSRRAWATS